MPDQPQVPEQQADPILAQELDADDLDDVAGGANVTCIDNYRCQEI